MKRFKQLEISASLILSHLKWLHQQGIILMDEPLPDDALVVGVRAEISSKKVSITIHSDTFEGVEFGSPFPTINFYERGA